MKNNTYADHGIGHLSYSFINSWVQSPWQAIGKLAGLEGSVGPAAYRGIAAESGLEVAIKTGDLSQGIMAAEFEFDQRNLGDPKGEKERGKLASYVENAFGIYEHFGQYEAYQKKIVFQHEDLPIPFVGYIDFLYPDMIRDTKTVARNVYSTNPSTSHCRQLAIYAFAYPDRDLWVDYVTPKETISHRVVNVEDHQRSVMKIIRGLEKFLSISTDTQELAAILTPDTDDWRFNDGIREQCDTIWPDITL